MPDKDKQNREENVSRRDIFHILGSVPIAAAATATSVRGAETHDHTAHGGSTGSAKAPPFQRRVFDDHQWKTVHVLCDLVIPADERSGSASQAGVPEFLDDWLVFRTQQDGDQRLQAQILGGLMWLDRESNHAFSKDFADASVDQQKQLLDRIAYPERAAKADSSWVEFFNEFRDLTVTGFFSSKVGVADLPYLGNTAVVEWKGCDPKVWAVIEDRMKNGYKGILKSQET
jgi:gluconate 2-dehydrogenase gamma chain